jgi:DNA repair ATPase RecN
MKFLRRLIMKNFQSHADTVFDFHPHLCTIIGNSDEGKSSAVRALAAVLQNDVSNAYVRHGADCFEVTVELDDGSRVTRVKGAKVNKYIVNGEEFERLGDSMPDKVREVLGYVGVLVDDSEIPVTISGQGVEPFLLSESAPVRAKLLGMISGLDVIDKALREMQKDSNQFDKEARMAAGLLLEQEKEAKELAAELLEKEVFFVAINAASAQYESIVGRFEKFKKLRDDFAVIESGRKAIYQVSLNLRDALSRISFDVLTNSVKKLKKLSELKITYRQVLEHESKTKKSLSDSIDFEKVRLDMDRLRSFSGASMRLSSLRRELSSIDNDIASKSKLLKLSLNDIEVIVIGDNFARIRELRKTLDKVAHIKHEHDALISAIADLDKKLVKGLEMVDDYKKQLASLDICPFCLRGIGSRDMEKILEQV